MPFVPPMLAAKVIAIVVLLGILSSGFFYIKSLRADLEVAEQEKIRLVDIVRSKDLVIKVTKEANDAAHLINLDVNRKFNEIEKERSDLARKVTELSEFKRQAALKPKETEVKLNLDAVKIARCGEIVSGSPLTAADDSNNICAGTIESIKRGLK